MNVFRKLLGYSKIYFLFSYDNDKKDKKKIINLDFKSQKNHKIKNITEKKNLSVELIELLYNIEKENENVIPEIETKIDNKTFILKIENIKKGINIIFNPTIIDKETKEEIKLNCFDINEEFDIYYNFFEDDIESLINSSIKLIEDGGKNSTFSFLFHMFSKYPIISEKIEINKLLFKIKHKGDLSKIDKDIYKSIPKYLNINPILIIYYFFNDINILKKIIDNEEYRNDVFNCLEKYNNLFPNSIELYPDYSFIIDKLDSIQKIITILKCSNKLSDFIYVINEKKEHISKYLEKILIINDFFNIKNIFNEPFNDNFYFSLFNIKEYSNKCNKLLIDYHPEEIENEILVDYFPDAVNKINVIGKIIFQYFIGKNKKEFKKQLKSLINEKNFKFSSLNNFEVFGIIDILCNCEDNEPLLDFGELIKNIKYYNINNDLLKYLSTINFDKIFENEQSY